MLCTLAQDVFNCCPKSKVSFPLPHSMFYSSAYFPFSLHLLSSITKVLAHSTHARRDLSVNTTVWGSDHGRKYTWMADASAELSSKSPAEV